MNILLMKFDKSTDIIHIQIIDIMRRRAMKARDILFYHFPLEKRRLLETVMLGFAL